MTDRPILGRIRCPHDDGDFELTVTDLAGWSTGSCLISQEGQGQKHDIAVKKEEAGQLAVILAEFARS